MARRQVQSARGSRPKNRELRAWQLLGLLLVSLTLTSCSTEQAETSTTSLAHLATESVPEQGDGTFIPLPRAIKTADPRVQLGEKLFFDPQLSNDRLVSCGSCHDPAQAWANGQFRTSLPRRDPTPVNVPSVTNMMFNFRFSWSGKFTELKDQIEAAMKLKDAMNLTVEAVVRRLTSDAEYKARFSSAYDDGLTAANVSDALVQYCASLTTPDSKFDRYLRKEVALSEAEYRGYQMFRGYGCASCHQGVNIGGNMYQRFGIVEDYFANKQQLSKGDLGLFAATGRPEDRHVFRVPSLRNVALTAPYFHDGSAATLAQAIQVMARYQLGRSLSKDQTEDLVAFLQTLTGVIPRPGAP